MKGNYIYKEACPSDIPQLQQLGLHSFSQFKDIISNETWRQWENTFTNNEKFSELLQLGTCFLCEFECKIIGMAFLIPHGNPTKLFSSEWAYIRLLCVDPNFEGQGIGRVLTELCMSFAKQSGEKILALHTSEFQHAARHIYESMGFTITSEFELHGKKYWIYKLEII